MSDEEIVRSITEAEILMLPGGSVPGAKPLMSNIEKAEVLAVPGCNDLRKEVANDGKPPGGVPPGKGSGIGDDDDGSGIIEELNSEYAHCLVGSKAVVLREKATGPFQERLRILSLEGFKSHLQNCSSKILCRERQPDGSFLSKEKTVRWAPFWLSSKERRQYDGLTFFPDANNVPCAPGFYNLWKGFACDPDLSDAKERWRKYSIFLDHVKLNICSGDETIFAWVWAWCAQLVQKPREKPGTAIALRGKMGTGKTKFGEIIGSLFGQHSLIVDDARYLTGNFNAHMAACVLLQADEAFWAGDKAAEGRLKGLVTSSTQMIENKGFDPIKLDNFLRIIFTSNEDWVIPAGVDERRFATLDVAPHCAQNHDYFREMDEQIANGGREALLADLLAFDLAAPNVSNLRTIPKTQALLEQKLRSVTA